MSGRPLARKMIEIQRDRCTVFTPPSIAVKSVAEEIRIGIASHESQIHDLRWFGYAVYYPIRLRRPCLDIIVPYLLADRSSLAVFPACCCVSYLPHVLAAFAYSSSYR